MQKINRLVILMLTALFMLAYASLQAQHALPRSVPEAEGVSSADILKFVQAASKSKNEFHSFMLLRHGKVIAEGWWDPYRSDLRHTLYSCSKSFTATAVGFAVTEKKLSLSDKVTSFFPNDLPDTVSSFLSGLTVKEVLMMSDGQEPDPTFAVASKMSNWRKGFLQTPIVHEPGTQFLYNSLGTYMLSAIVQKVTGQSTLDYLRPRLFEPLGITGEDWETDSAGINTGGWGLRLKTEDMAKFAELFLQKGKWNGKQILPESWVEEASSVKIMQDPSASQSKKDSSDWLQGYCYQMWRCRHDAYRGDGAYGQFMIVMPDQDAAIAITAETADMQDEINLVWEYLLPAFKQTAIRRDPSSQARLQTALKNLALPAAAGGKHVSLPAKRKFSFGDNDVHLSNASFDFGNKACTVQFTTDKGRFKIPFSPGAWARSETNMPGPSLTAALLEDNHMVYPAKIAGSYAWKDANTLQLVLRYIESPHSEIFTCHFHDDKVSMDVTPSIGFGKTVIHAEGTAD